MLKAILIEFEKFHKKGVVHADAWMDNIFVERVPANPALPCRSFKVSIIDLGSACYAGVNSAEYVDLKGIKVGDNNTPPEIHNSYNAPDEEHQVNLDKRENGVISAKTDLYTIVGSFIRYSEIVNTDFSKDTEFGIIAYDFMKWAMNSACNHQGYWGDFYNILPIKYAYVDMQKQRRAAGNLSVDYRNTDQEAIANVSGMIKKLDNYLKTRVSDFNYEYQKDVEIFRRQQAFSGTVKRNKVRLLKTNLLAEENRNRALGLATKVREEEQKNTAKMPAKPAHDVFTPGKSGKHRTADDRKAQLKEMYTSISPPKKRGYQKDESWIKTPPNKDGSEDSHRRDF
jgi:hypothetical protein